MVCRLLHSGRKCIDVFFGVVNVWRPQGIPRELEQNTIRHTCTHCVTAWHAMPNSVGHHSWVAVAVGLADKDAFVLQSVFTLLCHLLTVLFVTCFRHATIPHHAQSTALAPFKCSMLRLAQVSFQSACTATAPVAPGGTGGQCRQSAACLEFRRCSCAGHSKASGILCHRHALQEQIHWLLWHRHYSPRQSLRQSCCCCCPV